MTGVLEANKERENLRHLNVTFCSLSPHYNKISLANKKYPSHTMTPVLHQEVPMKTPWHFRSRSNKGKNPSSPWEGGTGMKFRQYEPKPLPTQWIFCPVIFTPLITSLPKKLRAAARLSLPALPPESVLLLNKSSLCFVGLRVSSLNSFCDETRTYSLVTKVGGNICKDRCICPTSISQRPNHIDLPGARSGIGLVWKTRQQAQSGVTYAKSHITRLNYNIHSPRILNQSTEITWSALVRPLIDPCRPLKEGDLAITNPLFCLL